MQPSHEESIGALLSGGACDHGQLMHLMHQAEAASRIRLFLDRATGDLP